MAELARKMGVHPSTLSVKTSAIVDPDQTAPAQFIHKLETVLGMDDGQLVNYLAEDSKTSDLYADTLLDRIADTRRASEHYMSEVLGMIRALKRGDVFTLATCEVPWEVKDSYLLGLMKEKLADDVKFNYLFPDTEDENLRRFLSRYTSWTILSMLPATIDEAFSDCREPKKPRVCVSSDPILVNPQWKIVHIRVHDYNEGDTPFFVMREFTAGPAPSIGPTKGADYTLWLPCSQSESVKLDKAIREELDER